MNMRKLFEMLGGRKLVLGFIVITIGVVMDMTAPQGLSSNLLYLLCFISTSFFLANAASTVAYSRQQNNVSDLSSTMDNSSMDSANRRLDEVQSQLEQVVAGTATMSQALVQLLKQTGKGK
jgi:hypothetical protein